MTTLDERYAYITYAPESAVSGTTLTDSGYTTIPLTIIKKEQVIEKTLGDTQIGITGNSSESQDPYSMIIDLKRIKTVYNIDFNLYTTDTESKKYIKDKLLYILGNNEHPDESTGRRDIGTESTFRLIYGRYNSELTLNEQTIETVDCLKVNFKDDPNEELNNNYSGKISLLRCVDATG